MQDPIADMITQIRNAQMVLKPSLEVPHSKLRYEIVKILEREGFLAGAALHGRKSKKFIELTLKYKDKEPAISGLKRISKPGQRIYVPFSRLKRVKGGFGMALISTSKGILTDKEARKQKIGGEIFFEVW